MHTPRIPQPLRGAMVIAAALLLSGCQPGGPEGLLGDYQARVSRVLQQPPPERTTPAVPRFPRHRDRAIAPPDVRVGVGDAFALRPCLGRLIGERNSILGRVMAPSTRLSYESRFAAAVEECAAAGATDAEMSQVLDEVAAAKAQALAIAGWNSAFDSDAVAAFLSSGGAPVAVTTDAEAIAGLDALVDLAALIDVGLAGGAVTESQIEPVLARLQNSRGAATVLNAATLLTAHLQQTAGLIETRLDARPLCLQPQPTRDARIAETVFHKFYAGQVQPYLSNVTRALTRLVDALSELLAVQRVTPRPAVVTYVQRVSELRDGLQNASRDHARAWQRLLGQCGRMPGG